MPGDGTTATGKPPMPGSSAPGETDEPAGLVDAFGLADLDTQPDPEVQRLARQIAERLAVPGVDVSEVRLYETEDSATTYRED